MNWWTIAEKAYERLLETTSKQETEEAVKQFRETIYKVMSEKETSNRDQDDHRTSTGTVED